MFLRLLKRVHQTIAWFYIAGGALLLATGLWVLVTQPLFGEEFFGNLVVVGMGSTLIGYGLFIGKRAWTLRAYFFGFAALVLIPGAAGLAYVLGDLSTLSIVLLMLGIASIGVMILVEKSHAKGSDNHVPVLYGGLAFLCTAFAIAGWIKLEEGGGLAVFFWVLAAWFAMLIGLLFYSRSVVQRDQRDQ